jgi:heme exporter protein B
MRSRTAYTGLALYLLVTQYLAFQLLQNRMEPYLFAALFWIIHLFMSVVLSQRLSGGGQEGAALFDFLLCDARHFIFSRILLIFCILSLLGLTSVWVMLLLYDISPTHFGLLLLIIIAGSLVYAALFGFMGSLGAGADNAHVLVAVLGFPLMIPTVLLTTRLTIYALTNGADATKVLQYLVSLSALGLIVSALAYLLFPYLWRR